VSPRQQALPASRTHVRNQRRITTGVAGFCNVSGPECLLGIEQLTTAVEQAAGTVTAMDVVESHPHRLVVDVTCNARDTNHAARVTCWSGRSCRCSCRGPGVPGPKRSPSGQATWRLPDTSHTAGHRAGTATSTSTGTGTTSALRPRRAWPIGSRSTRAAGHDGSDWDVLAGGRPYSLVDRRATSRPRHGRW
jgi:hypothetical protein